MKVCRVSYLDHEGVGHFCDVEADSLFEAAGLALARFRKCCEIDYSPTGGAEFTIEPREATTAHRLTVRKFEAWFALPGKSPVEVARRVRVRDALGIR